MSMVSLGKKFILTSLGYREIVKITNTTLIVGFPIKGFETQVPTMWLYKGWVREEVI